MTNDDQKPLPSEALLPAPADVISFIDEAGGRGYVRKLTDTSDHEVSVLCALPVPAEYVDYLRSEIRPLYDRFCAAAPAGAKLHITDAFRPGNEAWRAVAESVREEVFSVIKRIQLRVVYAARRSKLAREAHQTTAQIMSDNVAARKARGPTQYAIPGANRPSDEQIDDRLMIDLALLLDAFMETAERELTDLHFDQIDPAVAERYERMIERTRNVSYRRHEVKARNLETGENETRYIHMKADVNFRLDTVHLGRIVVAGKSDPLVFAVDVVANALWRHLSKLDPSAPLHEASSVADWELEPITFCNRSPDATSSLMDII